MELSGHINLYCERCWHAGLDVYFSAALYTVSSIKARAVEIARVSGWTVTRQKKCYCPSCAKALKLRGANYKGEG